MQIVFFVNHFFPSIGGVQWSVLRTAESLVRKGHHVTVVTETPDDTESDGAIYPFELIRFHVPLRRPLTRVGYWRWMWTQRGRFNAADVLHFHDYTTFFHWFLPLRLFITRPRYAVTFHGYEFWPIRQRHRIFRSVTAHLCHVRFAVGDYIRQLYHHPVDAVYIGAPVRDVPYRAGADDEVFAYAGRFAEDTAIFPLLRALSAASGNDDHVKKTQPLQLRLAGHGPLRDVIAQLGTSAFRIEFSGTTHETAALYDGARYIIATGYLGIFEAFASGIPVLVPAFNPLKRLYVESIPAAASMLTILGSEDESEMFFRRLLRGDEDDILQEKAAVAAAFVSDLRWDDITYLLETWYSPETRGKERPTSQLQVMERRRNETHAHR
jgi:glycosyltransferase involved in cell wall biosynthesis